MREKGNTCEDIKIIQKEMETMQSEWGGKNLERWKQHKTHLSEAYKNEEEYCSRKTRVNWLGEDDRNTHYFYAVTAEKKEKK